MDEVFGVPMNIIAKFKERLEDQDVTFVLDDYRRLYLENTALSKEIKLLNQQLLALQKREEIE